MESTRMFRLIEGSLVVMFFLQAARLVFSTLLTMTHRAISGGQLQPQMVYAHLILLAAWIPAWFSPRSRSTLPALLLLSAVLAAAARVLMAVTLPIISLYAAIGLIGVAAIYLASLLRANRVTWLTVVVAGLCLDQLIRARDTLDISLLATFGLTVGTLRYRIPWIVIQIGLSLFLILAAILARRAARREAYEPAFLRPLGGLALGSFFMLQLTLLGMPAVIARWAGVSYAGVVPWLLLATALPLIPSVRAAMSETLAFVDERSRGWVWLFVLLLLILVGNRLGRPGGAGALIVAQFVAILLLWWIPTSPDPSELEEVGPSISLAGLTLFLLVYAYSLTFEQFRLLLWLRHQALVVFLTAAGLLGIPRLPWRDHDPWLEFHPLWLRLAPAFVYPVVVLGLVLAGYRVAVAIPAPGETVRVATYNINSGYDATGTFQLEQIATTIQTSLADIVVVQEVDAGHPGSYGVDQVEFLARRLAMYHAFFPTTQAVRGIGILSRWPITSYQGVMLPSSGEQLGAIQAVVTDTASGRQLTIVGAQFEPGTDDSRLPQLAVLVNLMGEGTTLVLAADLAGSPGDLVYQQLLARDFVDPDQVLGIERGFTYPADFPTARLDYILTRGLLPLNALQVQSAASDHRLVVVELAWR